MAWMPPIVWHTSARTPDGYGDEARGFLRSLESHGVNPGLRDLSGWTDQRAGLSASEEAMLLRQESRFARTATPSSALHVHHYVPGAALKVLGVEGALNVSRSTFETDRIPSSWLPYLALVEEIWVPTEFNVQTYADSGVPPEKLRVLGQTLDFELFDPSRQVEPLEIPGVPEGSFVFLANFDFSERKGWKQLLEAWRLAFNPNDPVCLVLKTATISFAGQHIHERINEFFGAASDAAPVVVYSHMLEAEDMPRLYASADAYVLPSRGEGWGRPYMEALSLNMPTIASHWSGQLAFMKPEYSWLVPGEIVPVPDDAEIANGLYRGHSWFEADVEELASAMREVASDPAAARAKAGSARESLLAEFSPAAIAAQTAALADDLWERRSSSLSVPVGSLWVSERPEAPGLPGGVLGMQAALESSSGGRYLINSLRSYPELSAVNGITFDYQAPGQSCPMVGLVDQGVSGANQVASLSPGLDLIAVPDGTRKTELIEAGAPEGLIMVLDRSAWQQDFGMEFSAAGKNLVSELERLVDSGVLPVRAIDPALIDAEGEAVLWMPDFAGPWEQDLERWLSSNREGKTLVIWSELSEEELAAHMGRLEGRLEGEDPTPDVLLLLPEDQPLEAAVLASHEMLCGSGSFAPLAAARRLPCA